MPNTNQNQPKTPVSFSEEEFPALFTPNPEVKQESKKSPSQSKTFLEDFPALVQNTPLSEPALSKQEMTPLQSKKQQFLIGFPSLVSNPTQMFRLGEKQVWETSRKPSRPVNLNRSHQIFRAPTSMNSTNVNNSIQRQTLSTVSALNNFWDNSSRESERRSSTSSVTERFIDSSSDSEAENEGTESWPNFEELRSKVKKILEFKIPLTFPTVEHCQYKKANGFDYSTHYELARVHQFFPETSQSRKWAKWTKLGNFRILVINCDFNIPSRNGYDESSETDDSDGLSDYKRIIKVYWKTTEQERARQIVHQIKLAIIEGVDFICLEEICQPIIRQKVLAMLEGLKNLGQNQYFFPRNLETHPYMRTTMILSKYPVKFGHLKFEIQEFFNKDQTIYYFPLQAFCEFEIMFGKKVQKVGILCCHLRSNGEKKSDIRPHKMRKMQVRCIHDFSKRFDKFFCVGDTNIPSSQKFKNENIWLKKRFVDAFDVGHSSTGGTYMYRTKANVVKEERMDRLWMKKDMKDSTDVQIAFKEVLLESCKNKRFNKKEMLGLDEEKLIYISPSDHEILKINIQFTKYE